MPCPCTLVLKIVQDRDRPYESVYTTAHEVYSTSELNAIHTIAIRPIRFHTIAIRSIRFKYDLYIVICDFYTFSVEGSKIREAKSSKRVNFISKHTLLDKLYYGNLYTLFGTCYELPNDSCYVKRLLNVQ